MDHLVVFEDTEYGQGVSKPSDTPASVARWRVRFVGLSGSGPSRSLAFGIAPATVAYLPFVCSYDGSVARCWDLRDGRVLAGFAKVRDAPAMALCPKGHHAAFIVDGSLEIWDVLSGEQLRKVYSACDAIAVSFPPTGPLLALSRKEAAIDRKIRGVASGVRSGVRYDFRAFPLFPHRVGREHSIFKNHRTR